MNSDSTNLKFGKARQEKFLQDAENRRLLAACQREDREACEIEPRRATGGIKGLIRWIFRLDVAEGRR